MPRIPTRSEIERLVTVNASESAVLEFKAATYAPNDNGRKECLKDITAFANTRGGTLLIGVSEKNNAADHLTPLTLADAEVQRSRINDLLGAGIDPRLYGVMIEPVEMEAGVVLAVSIPRSSARPHRVTTGNSNRFWIRSSTAAQEANVSDLRSMFLQNADFSDRAEQYHRTRSLKFRDNDIVPNFAKAAEHAFAMHVIPADSTSTSVLVDPAEAHKLSHQFRSTTQSGYSDRFTFDGFLNYRGGDVCHGYTLVQRSGVVESIQVPLMGGDDVPALTIETRAIRRSERFIKALQELGVSPPFYVFVSILGVRGRKLNSGVHQWGDNTTPPNQGILHLPVAVIENADNTQSIAMSFKPALDALWNAWGFVGSSSYKDGRWIEREQE